MLSLRLGELAELLFKHSCQERERIEKNTLNLVERITFTESYRPWTQTSYTHLIKERRAKKNIVVPVSVQTQLKTGGMQLRENTITWVEINKN